jgi:hypothetical protein
MKKRFGYFILIGLLIGAIFGSGLGAANESALAGLGLGALAGIFVGWFVAAAVLENEKK